jgi:hypothetical protein
MPPWPWPPPHLARPACRSPWPVVAMAALGQTRVLLRCGRHAGMGDLGQPRGYLLFDSGRDETSRDYLLFDSRRDATTSPNHDETSRAYLLFDSGAGANAAGPRPTRHGPRTRAVVGLGPDPVRGERSRRGEAKG